MPYKPNRTTNRTSSGAATTVVLPPSDCPPTAIWVEEFELDDSFQSVEVGLEDSHSVEEDRLYVEGGFMDSEGNDDALSSDVSPILVDSSGFREISVTAIADGIPDSQGNDDMIHSQPVLFDSLGFRDEFYQADVKPIILDKPAFAESFLCADIEFAATQDSWTDEGSPNTNHGTDTTLQIQQGVVLVTDGNNAYIAWDLTSMTTDDWEEISGDEQVSLRFVMNPPVVNVLAEGTVRSLISDTQPWTENGITWNNQPDHNTVEGTFTLNLIGGGFVLNFDMDATVNDVLGKWVSISMTFEALVAVVGIFTVDSKENATKANWPRMFFKARHLGPGVAPPIGASFDWYEDHSGNGYHLTPGLVATEYASPTIDKFITGRQFQGDANRHLEVVSTDLNIRDDIAITCVFRWDEAPLINNPMNLVYFTTNGNTNANDGIYNLQVFNGTTGANIRFRRDNANIVSSSAGSIVVGNTYRVTVRLVGGNAELKIDGVSVDTASGVAQSTNNPSGVLAIGGRNDGNTQGAFNGVIYDVRIWDTPPSQAALDSVVSTTGIDTLEGSEIAAYRLRDTDISRWFWEDSSGNDYHLATGLALTEQVTSPVGKFNSGRRFVTDSLLRVEDDAFNITGDQCATVVFDLETLQTSGNHGFFNYGVVGGTGATRGLNLLIGSTGSGNNDLIVSMWNNGAQEQFTASAAVSTGYHTCTIRIDDTANTIVVKLDGSIVINTTYTTPRTSVNGGVFLVGGHRDDGVNTFPGIIYDLRIWDTLESQANLDAVVSSTGTDAPTGSEMAVYRMRNI